MRVNHAATPLAAHAATVHVGKAPASPYPCCVHGIYSADWAAVYYVASPGEQNQLTVDVVEQPQRVEVTLHHDIAVPIEPRAGCVAVDERTVRCSGYDNLTGGMAE
jgi:hypothetical protein